MGEHYKIISLLGEGAYGKCYLVETASKHEKRVIKQIDLNPLSRDAQSEALREAKILEQLNHPNIIKFHEVYKTKRKKLCIVMDYADGGDLSMRIKGQVGAPLSESQILDYFVQICLAIKHVHDRKILHRDLKAQNIFLMKSGVVKLGDFGIAKVLTNTRENAKSMVGTPYYLSPEIVQNKPYSFKSDIWSLGVLLYEMCALRPPFEASSIHGLAMKIVSGKYSPLPSHFSQGLKSLVSALLTLIPEHRPSIHEVLWMPVVQQRIHHCLEESIAQQEFSHTILHGYNILERHRSAPQQGGEAVSPVESTFAEVQSAVVRTDTLSMSEDAIPAPMPTEAPPNVPEAAPQDPAAEATEPPTEQPPEQPPEQAPEQTPGEAPQEAVVLVSEPQGPSVNASMNNEEFLTQYNEAQSHNEKRRVMLEDIKEKKFRHSMRSVEIATMSDIHLQGLESPEEIQQAKERIGEVVQEMESQARILEMQEALLEHPTEAQTVEIRVVETVTPDRDDELPEPTTTPLSGDSSELSQTSGLGKLEAMCAYLEEVMGDVFYTAIALVREIVDQKTEDEVSIDLLMEKVQPLMPDAGDDLEKRILEMLVLLELEKEVNGS